MKDIFTKPFFVAIAFLVTLLFSTLSLGIAIRSTIYLTFTLPVDSLQDRVALVLTSVKAIPLNFTSEAVAFIFIIAFLTGINVALIVYYIRSRSLLFRKSGAGFLGAFAGIIGVGCASCGSVLLSSIMGLSASTTLIGALPLRGTEFSLLAVALLVYSIYALSRKVSPERVYACDL